MTAHVDRREQARRRPHSVRCRMRRAWSRAHTIEQHTKKAHAGTRAPARGTLTYAPPEIVRAHLDSADVAVDASHDMWSVGVMAYEAITGSKVFDGTTHVFDAARLTDPQPYPWEAPDSAFAAACRQFRLRAVVLQCLSRDAAARPSAAALLSQMERIGEETEPAAAAAAPEPIASLVRSSSF